MSYENLIQSATKKIARIVPTRFHNSLSLAKHYLFRGYGNIFYAQDGIDAVLRTKLNKTKIFYVDVGANHPFWASNTYAFYKNGSRGINIDAMPGSMKLFRLTRRRDVNLEVPISSDTKERNFYVFESSALNTFDERLAKERAKKGRLLKVIKVRPQKLSDILDKYLENKTIDLLSVDTEGHDLEVLRSNDWEKYRPRFIIVEDLIDFNKLNESKLVSYLLKKGYKIIAFTGMNILFESE